MLSSEFLALRYLIARPEGMYGADFVEASNGRLKRSSIYVILQRMNEKKVITSELVPGDTKDDLPRRRYRISAHGARAFRNELAVTGLELAPALGQPV